MSQYDTFLFLNIDAIYDMYVVLSHDAHGNNRNRSLQAAVLLIDYILQSILGTC